MAESKKKFTTETLLEKIPAETCWKITAKTLLNIALLRGVKTVFPLLGKGEGIISPVMGFEKWREIVDKIWAESGRKIFPWVKKTFNIAVKDAVGAVKLAIVTGVLTSGPEGMGEIFEDSRERVVVRRSKCGWMERYKELEVDPELITCDGGHLTFAGEGLKAIDPRINFKITKAMPWGDPYCELVYEFKEVE